ncbi:MAG: Gx transporter family protein [Clostridia bacterium]|nr:Gx transporter family protein [Clostridia bacterium]
MSAKQGNCGNRINIKSITLYALFVAVCLIIGYLESLLSISLIAVAPGVKLGLSNAIALTLICRGDTKGAWAVNITRICLSALLFGSPISFLFSLAGGVASTAVACILSKLKSVSAIGISIAGGAVHNIFQCVAATVFVGVGVVYYLPALLIFGALCGAFCGVLVKLVLNKIKINGIF